MGWSRARDFRYRIYDWLVVWALTGRNRALYRQVESGHPGKESR